MNKFFLLISSIGIIFIGCTKPKQVAEDAKDLQKQVLIDYGNLVCLSTYEALSDATFKLHSDISDLVLNPDDIKMEKCRQDWKIARSFWENYEAWLFGPVATNSIDPRIDTWPVDFVRLDSVLTSGSVLNSSYVSALEESLKGFHPMEYLLFGLNGDKKAADLTSRQMEFLLALSLDLKTLTLDLRNSWKPSNGNFLDQVIQPGNGKNFPDKKSVYIEMVTAIAGICDEVANEKIGSVFINQDSMGEESPYSKNSIEDFKNNILGVKNVYFSNFNGKDGKGLEDIVREYNLSLDASIKLKMNNALSALDNITDPFGKAIHTQPIQIQNAIDAINALKADLEDKVLPLIQIHIGS